MSPSSDPQVVTSLPTRTKPNPEPTPPISPSTDDYEPFNNKSNSTTRNGSITPALTPQGTAVTTAAANTSLNTTTTTTTTINPNELKRSPSNSIPKKPTMTSRISGMFKKDNDKKADSSKASTTTPSRTPSTVKPKDTSTVPSSAASTTSSKHPSSPPSGLVDVNGSTARKAPLDDNGHPKRFWVNDDGSHEHYLKVAKRHQKLKDMMRGFFEKKKQPQVEEAQPLTLLNDWVKQQKSDLKAKSDIPGGPGTNSNQTLVEKYGKCHEIIGHGAFGIVRIAHKVDPRDSRKEQLFAVKEFHKRPNESAKKYQKRLTSEFCLSSSMQHPNVIQTLDLLQDDKGDYCEVMEYCSGGDLYTLILAAGNLESAEADCYFKQLMRGVEYMHEMGVAHRDLKPENLLLTARGALKITDFGNGECFRMAWEKEAHMTAGLCGSAPYIAPEEYVDKEFDPRAVDVWACGVIYMAMRTGRHLWRVAQKGEDEFFDRYLQDRKEESGFRPIEVLRRRQCRNVIYSVLDPSPTRRLTASEILQSEWLRDAKVCKAGEEGH